MAAIVTHSRGKGSPPSGTAGGDGTLPQRLAYSPHAAADATGLSVETIYRAIRDGELGAVKRRRRWLIPVSALRTFCGETVAIRRPAAPAAKLPPEIESLVRAALG